MSSTDQNVIRSLLSDAGVALAPEDVERLVELHERELRHVAELRRIAFRWDGPEPETALRWLELTAGGRSA